MPISQSLRDDLKAKVGFDRYIRKSVYEKDWEDPRPSQREQGKTEKKFEKKLGGRRRKGRF